MPRTVEQFKEMREKSIRVIIDTAMRLFSTEGYHSTSISKIAKEAGIATGLVYNYFKSKDDLLEAIIKDSMEEFDRLFFLQAKGFMETNNLAGLIETVFDVLKVKIDSWRLFIRILLQPDVSEIGKRVGGDFSRHIAEFSIKYFQNKGEKDPQKKAEVMGVILHGAFIMYVMNGNDEELELVKNELIQNYL